MIKVSDLRHLFGHTTQTKPLYRRRDSDPHEVVAGARSDKLKFKTKLCARCNNQRTQPHDRSWEALAKFLREREPPAKAGDVVRTARAFSSGVRPGMLGVHLYFLKLFGCLVHDGGAPIETGTFAESILNNTPHPHVYLSFLAVSGRKFQRQAVITPLQTMTIGTKLSGAFWYYFVGQVGVQVTWAPEIYVKSKKIHLFHPSQSSKTITMDGV